MDRRRFLGTVAGTGAAALAGCTGGEDAESNDSDGDGVSDAEDYASKDPDVQSKSDLEGVSGSAATATTTADPDTPESETTTSSTTTTARATTTATTTASTDANTLTVGDGWSDRTSHVTAYSSRSVTAHVVPDGLDVSDIEGRSTKLLAIAYRYPRGEAVAYGTSDPVTLDAPTELTADVDLAGADVASGERLHYMLFLAPGDADVEELSSSDLVHFHETDAFALRGDGVTVERSPPPAALADDSGDRYSREAVEGAYRLSFDGSTQGKSWSGSFYIYKSTYAEAVAEPRGRSRSEYVAYAQQTGFADELAAILADEAEANGFTDKRLQVEFVIDFVQNLPYVPDDVSKGFDDYTKFITETVVEAGGDCEDTAIMLAAVLQAEPFGYDTVLIQPPEHMAAGVYGEDLDGSYWTYEDRDYYYIETTGTGWGIGDLPETYRGEEAYVHQV